MLHINLQRVWPRIQIFHLCSTEIRESLQEITIRSFQSNGKQTDTDIQAYLIFLDFLNNKISEAKMCYFKALRIEIWD